MNKLCTTKHLLYSAPRSNEMIVRIHILALLTDRLIQRCSSALSSHINIALKYHNEEKEKRTVIASISASSNCFFQSRSGACQNSSYTAAPEVLELALEEVEAEEDPEARNLRTKSSKDCLSSEGAKGCGCWSDAGHDELVACRHADCERVKFGVRYIFGCGL